MIRDPGPPGHHHLHLFQDHRWAVAGAVTMYLTAALVFALVGFGPTLDWVQRIDARWHDAMASLEHPIVTVVARALDVLGSAMVIGALFGRRKRLDIE